MNHRPLRHQRLWLALGYVACAILLYACLMPNPPQVDVTGFDKVEHMLAYLVLGAWFAAIVPKRLGRVFIGLVVFGIGIECLQGLTEYRSFDVYDILADTVGTIIGIALARLGAMRWLDWIDAHARPTGN